MFVRSRLEAQQLASTSKLTIEQVLQGLESSADISESTWIRIDSTLKVKARKGN